LSSRFCLGWFSIHFFCICAISCRDTFSTIARGLTWFPRPVESYFEQADGVVAAAMGESLEDSNPLRQTLTSYLHCAGIEGGYGFFAPAVPDSYKLIFQLQYSDGRVGYELPQVTGDAAGLRLTSLLQYIGQIDHEPLRRTMLKMLAFRTWQQHRDAMTARAVFGYIEQPTAAEAAQGKSEAYKFLYAYDFTFRPETSGSPAQ
jgi:hypothetical protein